MGYAEADVSLPDAHARRIFIELSDEYKTMDPATPDVGKRRILASHLKESVDVLELKVSQDKQAISSHDIRH